MLKNIIKWFYFFIKYKKNRISIAITSNVSINSTFEGFNKIHSKSKFKGHIGLCSYIGSHANLSSVHISPVNIIFIIYIILLLNTKSNPQEYQSHASVQTLYYRCLFLNPL